MAVPSSKQNVVHTSTNAQITKVCLAGMIVTILVNVMHAQNDMQEQNVR